MRTDSRTDIFKSTDNFVITLFLRANFEHFQNHAHVRQTDRHTERHTDKQIDKQTDRKK